MDEKTTITALYDRREDAQKALRELQNMGVSRDDISLIASDAAGEYNDYHGRDFPTEKDSTEGAVAGAAVGGLGGLVVGLAALAIPGIGPVLAAGPIASALVSGGIGAGVGALTGGLIGGLTDMGVSEEEAGYYAEGVRRGGTLLTAHVPDDMSSRVMNTLNDQNAVNVEERVSQWRESGWQAYDPNAEPYDVEAIGREQSRYGVGDTNRERDQHGAGNANRDRNQGGFSDARDRDQQGVGDTRGQGQYGGVGDTRERDQHRVTPMGASSSDASKRTE